MAAETVAAGAVATGSGRRRPGIRVRTTVAATLVVALALLAGAAALVLLVRHSLADGVESTAGAMATATAAQISAVGPPRTDPDEERDDDPADSFTEVRTADGRLVSTTSPGFTLPDSLSGTGRDRVRLERDEAAYTLRSASTTWQGVQYVVTAAVTLEEVDDATEALLGPLLAGIPVLLLVVAGTTWAVVSRALQPVERIRAEVAAITDDRLDRRVPDPGSRDEIGRLAGTMNAMLARLERGRAQQQRFVSDASHELRSPIATLRQAAEVSQAHPDAFEPGELADTVAAESVRMQRLVEQLLVLARSDEGPARSLGEVDLDDLVLAEAARLRRRGTAVDTSAVAAVRLHGSQVAWTQVLRNLTDNAARHASGAVALTLAEEEGRVLLRVDDDGSGVPAGERERIFDRFVRLDEARSRDSGGSGLGLAIVRDLVTAMGGEVRLGDSPAGGARFEVSVPRGR